ncbi:AT-rich interactive domain-containing protein 5B isoform X2 [Myripristis murdjan]|uniref:AT-rich interactive domain-containing protein 5B isoform X2 n=1 Tax=Myripristis murdjan TaxID=586833 RepID=UPI0011763CEC|nr:AT-rich interactive domain-containing protein 5B-like isoform X2 [Myripristis murdjan]
MEHNAIQWLGAPSCLRGGYAFYKSVSSTAQPGGPVQVWKLGEFYYIRCGPQEPACIAEVTLLWEDQTQRHLLASARLYFLPEDTPKGRTREHGEDEVLAVSRKMVVRVEDLVRWSCPEPASWRNTRTNGLHKAALSTNTPDKSSEPLRDKTDNGPVQQQQQQQQGVKVLSYPQYCRFRSLQRRIQDRAGGPGLQDPHLLALGGIRLALPNMRVMYCRDTFSHPTLESNSNFWWQFRCPSLSLRGRPRKRRGRDSKDSPTSSQSDSWIERMKENVMGSVEMGCEGGWLPHPEEQLFLDQLYTFMERHGSPIHKVPNLGFKKIDLFLMYSVVKRLGGYEKVTSERLWKVVYNELGGCPGSTSAATCTRRHYERLMLPYEEHLRAGGPELKVPESPAAPKPRGIRGRKPLPRGRKPSAKAREKKIITPPRAPAAVVNPDGTVVVKRGRGRPPGKRNKATLIAQAKLLAQQQAKVKAAASQQQNATPAARGSPALSSQRKVQQPLQKAPAQAVHPALHPANLPLTPDLSPMSSPFLPFQPKPGKEQERGSSLTQPSSPGVLLSVPPRPFVGGSLGGFSPTKGMCPLDVFRSRLGLQRGLESPALTPQDPAQHHPAVYPLQPKSGSLDTPLPGSDQPQPQPQPHLLHHHHHRCTGCNLDDGAQRGGSRDGKNRPPLPPLRVLPLDLDCSVQVRQLMRTRLGSAQFQSFTRRLSEVLSQDLSAKPPCSPITPPPEQALPLNLSKRFLAKRPPSDDPEPRETAMNGGSGPQPSSKRPRDSCGDQVKAEDFSLGGRSGGSGGGRALEMKIQEEPADLSSPSRIRAFLLGLQPFHVKLEEDLNGASLVKPLPPPSEATSQRTEAEHGERGGNVTIEVKKEEETIKTEHDESERSEKESSQEDKPPNEEPAAVKAEFVKAEDVKMERQDVKEEAEASVASSMDQIGDLGGQQMPREEKMECDVEASAKGLPSPVLPQPTALALAQQS